MYSREHKVYVGFPNNALERDRLRLVHSVSNPLPKTSCRILNLFPVKNAVGRLLEVVGEFASSLLEGGSAPGVMEGGAREHEHDDEGCADSEDRDSRVAVVEDLRIDVSCLPR